MDSGQKTSNRVKCKGQSALTRRGERRLRRFERSKRSLTLAQITTHGMTVQSYRLCNSRFSVWVSGAIDLREYHCSVLEIGLHVYTLHGLHTRAQRLECRRLEASCME
ncbi:hypothetical protein TNCV_1598401 [Trichonephila clavipes]|nr:hypothetical protein TNCV_1598401 [Trichonephila clavipes]